MFVCGDRYRTTMSYYYAGCNMRLLYFIGNNILLDFIVRILGMFLRKSIQGTENNTHNDLYAVIVTRYCTVYTCHMRIT